MTEDEVIDAVAAGTLGREDAVRLLIEAGVNPERAEYQVETLASVDVHGPR